MKKVLPLLALLLALGAVVVFTMRRAGGSGANFPASRAAELVPADAIAYVEIVDVDRAVERWRRCELGAMAGEADWPAARLMAMKWLGRAHPNAVKELYLCTELMKGEPSGAFLAVTALGNWPLPNVVGGVCYRAKKAEIETVVRGLKVQLRNEWPGATSELSTHRGVEIESITCATPPQIDATASGTYKPPHASMQLAFRDDWFFFATDRALLEGVLDRYLGKLGVEKSLAAVPAFVESRKQALPGADVLAWARWEPVVVRLVARVFPLITQIGSDPKGPEALLYSYSLDTPQSRDRWYLHLGSAPRASALGNRSIARTTPQTVGYAVMNFDALCSPDNWLAAWLRYRFSMGNNLSFAMARMSRKTEGELKELLSALGPELSFTLEGGRQDRRPAPVWPEMAVTCEVRDAARGLTMASLLGGSGKPKETEMNREKVRWFNGSENPAECVALAKGQLVFGWETLRWLHNTGPTLEANPEYVAAAKAAPAPNGMFLYLDTPEIFECVCERMRNSFSALNSNPRPDSDEELPRSPGPVFRELLQPGTLCLRTGEQGWVMDGTLGVVGDLMLLFWLQGGD